VPVSTGGRADEEDRVAERWWIEQVAGESDFEGVQGRGCSSALVRAQMVAANFGQTTSETTSQIRDHASESRPSL